MSNLVMRSLRSPVILMLAVMLFPQSVMADDPIPDPTGGLLKAVQKAENMEPSIVYPEQEEEAKAKLAAFEKKHGTKPNILIFLVDDMGWGIPVYMEADMPSEHRRRTSISWLMKA